MRFFVIIMMIWASTTACSHPKLEVVPFGKAKGQEVNLFTIDFPGKLRAQVINYGGILTSLEVPDREGNLADIVLGYDSLSSYLEKTPYFGAILGRYGNRIAGGQFSINDKHYQLATNNGPNHLHGGLQGFDKVVWQAKSDETENSVIITLKYVSPDGEEGYPGNLSSTVTYTFTENQVAVSYFATTDQPTVVNLSQHTYFNLSACKEDILSHELQLSASRFLPVDSVSIPTGELRSVSGTPFDFTESKRIGKQIEQKNQQLQYGNGYDHCWVLDAKSSEKPSLAGTLYHQTSGRLMEVYTTEPGIQLYTGNYLGEKFAGKNGFKYPSRYGLCLETQHFPDSPNQLDFPSTVLLPGDEYKSETIFRFGVKTLKKYKTQQP